MLALIRPDSWNFPLLVHVLGAMVLVGCLVCAAAALLVGWRRDSAALTWLAFRTLLLGALPGYIVMRIGAQWVYSREGFHGKREAAWIVIGFLTADLGALLLLVTLVLTDWLREGSVRRVPARARSGAPEERSRWCW